MRDEDDADDDAPGKIAEDNLQKPKVTAIGDSGRANYSKSAGFGRNNGERNRPPGNGTVGKELIPE
jgi:hypothetical protein